MCRVGLDCHLGIWIAGPATVLVDAWWDRLDIDCEIWGWAGPQTPLSLWLSCWENCLGPEWMNSPVREDNSVPVWGTFTLINQLFESWGTAAAGVLSGQLERRAALWEGSPQSTCLIRLSEHMLYSCWPMTYYDCVPVFFQCSGTLPIR